ncbi:uncharacterized protein YraI [Nakamurella sp. UYEF19]|uniref:hypothetical protein n=1 Tax=Nakamurella sp. UYEF19 TaxID=1756392 RepID=UPI0033960E03
MSRAGPAELRTAALRLVAVCDDEMTGFLFASTTLLYLTAPNAAAGKRTAGPVTAGPVTPWPRPGTSTAGRSARPLDCTAGLRVAQINWIGPAGFYSRAVGARMGRTFAVLEKVIGDHRRFPPR